MTDENGTVLGSIIDERILIATHLAAQIGVEIFHLLNTTDELIPDEIVHKIIGMRVLKELIPHTVMAMPSSTEELYAGLQVVLGPEPGETLQ